MIDALLQPLDLARTQLYRVFRPWVAPWVSRRELRVAAIGVIAIVVALGMSITVPLWMLALGPILLGVPHVLADLRYLWVQPGFHRQRALWLSVVPLLLVGGATADVSWALGAALIALFVVDTSALRRVAGAAVLLPLIALSVRWSWHATLIFAHAHNLIAVALWWAVWPRRQRWHWLVLLLIVTGTTLIGCGALDSSIEGMRVLAGSELAGRGIGYHARSLAPWAGPVVGARVAVLFAFAQAVHYTIWLRLVPEEARSRPSPRPFRSSYLALRRELGVVVLALAAGGCLLFAIWAAMDLWAARDGYLRAAVVHGHLELAAAALLFARGARPARGA